MVEGAEDARDRRLRLNRLIGSFGVAPVLEALEPLGVGEEGLGRMQSGLGPLDDGVMELLEDMSNSLGAGMLEAGGEEPAGLHLGGDIGGDAAAAADELEATEGEGEAVIPAPGLEDFLGRGLSGVDLSIRDGGGDPEHPDYPVERLASRSWSWEEHEAEKRASLRVMHRLAMMTQHRLGVKYHNHLAVFEMVAKIEWMLIYLGETLPEPGMGWSPDRRMRELNIRASRLLWVQRERNREHGGVRGIFNWLTGRQRLTAKELMQRMLTEADDIMGVVPEGGWVMGLRLPAPVTGWERERYVEAVGYIEGGGEDDDGDDGDGG